MRDIFPSPFACWLFLDRIRSDGQRDDMTQQDILLFLSAFVLWQGTKCLMLSRNQVEQNCVSLNLCLASCSQGKRCPPSESRSPPLRPFATTASASLLSRDKSFPHRPARGSELNPAHGQTAHYMKGNNFSSHYLKLNTNVTGTNSKGLCKMEFFAIVFALFVWCF